MKIRTTSVIAGHLLGATFVARVAGAVVVAKLDAGVQLCNDDFRDRSATIAVAG
ncbi:MAG: hypothetical protein IPM60_16555 [Rhodospirillales bacterium]|nr:hypothetical protein [Rhodospirillales bacterium]